MILDDLYDGILVINADDQPGRWAEAKAELDRVGCQSYQRFSAVVPTAVADRRERGKRGCLLSHLGCLKMAQNKRWKSVLILEDDLVFEPDFAEHAPVAARFVEKQTWHMFYWGVWHWRPARPSGHPGILHVTAGICTHAYAVHWTAYGELIKILSSEKRQPVDNAYVSRYHAKDRYSFAITPRLIYQRAGMSTITGAHAGDPSWLRDPRPALHL